MDIGQYNITKDEEGYEVTEMLSGKVKKFPFVEGQTFQALEAMMEWIRQNVEQVEEAT